MLWIRTLNRHLQAAVPVARKMENDENHKRCVRCRMCWNLFSFSRVARKCLVEDAKTKKCLEKCGKLWKRNWKIQMNRISRQTRFIFDAFCLSLVRKIHTNFYRGKGFRCFWPLTIVVGENVTQSKLKFKEILRPPSPKLHFHTLPCPKSMQWSEIDFFCSKF